ncbi:MAG: glycoside hydrolase family 3 C-terminal domain-containing protein, partial [Actinomycetes bacterium]|nr:glycoside hydrolase family 3 C-terminal domain-containing protein [Actinomycetes bacterium]
TFGEDPVLLGAMGAALTAGVQPWVMACVKHYALNSMEEARFVVDVQVPNDVLHEAFLPHFRTIVEAGVDAVMSSYNSVNGTWAGENRALLTDIFRGQWGFRGFVMTDFVWGLRHPVESVAAGQDLEMPFAQQRAAALLPALKDGRLAKADVERAASRLLGAQIRLALRARPTPPADVVASAAHRDLAREVARAGTVLLRNEPVDDDAPLLPLDADAVGRVAVVGYLADEANLGDVGSSQVHPPSAVSVLAGLRERLGERVTTVDPAADQDTAVAAVREAEVAVVVVGLGPKDEGEAMVATEPETFQALGGLLRHRPVARLANAALKAAGRFTRMGGDRRELGLHPIDVSLIRAVAAANPRTVVVVIGGGPMVLAPWDAEVAAVLLAWYPGMEGGRAIADLLLGSAEPGGRLPVVLPGRREDLPAVDWLARSVEYSAWWGQRWLDRNGVEAAYPFGFGLGYSSFWMGE